MANLNFGYETINALLAFAQSIGLVDGVVESDGSQNASPATTLPLTIIDGAGNTTVYNIVVVN